MDDKALCYKASLLNINESTVKVTVGGEDYTVKNCVSSKKDFTDLLDSFKYIYSACKEYRKYYKEHYI